MSVVCLAVEKGALFCQSPVGDDVRAGFHEVGRRVGGTRLNDVKESQPSGNRLFWCGVKSPSLSSDGVGAHLNWHKVKGGLTP